MADKPEVPQRLSDPESWVDQYGDYLFRFAMLRIRDSRNAEDLVQETLLGALQARKRFAGQSTERSWLVGILKHKIVDHYRRAGRETVELDVEALAKEVRNQFDEEGHWKRGQTEPRQWGEDPGSLLERKQFWVVLQRCLSELSPRHAAVFSLREIDDLSSEDIRKMLNITASNLWVMLHRARAHLRQCLEWD
ncbi:MAG: sigma-70 family RNA polymerase sigma factor, partial [Nitrospirales bacterium]